MPRDVNTSLLTSAATNCARWRVPADTTAPALLSAPQPAPPAPAAAAPARAVQGTREAARSTPRSTRHTCATWSRGSPAAGVWRAVQSTRRTPRGRSRRSGGGAAASAGPPCWPGMRSTRSRSRTDCSGSPATRPPAEQPLSHEWDWSGRSRQSCWEAFCGALGLPLWRRLGDPHCRVSSGGRWIRQCTATLPTALTDISGAGTCRSRPWPPLHRRTA
jgi:hypothetical protein